ncbi:MAG: lytic transglycosylase domain-containing protein [Desulfuromonadaceae bacterium]|nr:lytic transglycosylase domain-containing protein [Desulfuromonadaceae bacterium]MDD2848357.1 lytic transglycosylase domain-containing protein [Desulfuromonadaceae bacterium]MDD4129247.1 lytic transglycosylase domain-containing protein [Desulfuromonadaceae bacterium]
MDKMLSIQQSYVAAAILCLTAVLLFAPLTLRCAGADIYRYVDEDDIVHFTDAPTDKRFKIFMRDLKKDKQLRTKLKYASSVNPAEFEQLIKTCSDKYGVSSSLIKAVIHAESGYNPNAVSSKGASGLMQLMPATAKSLKVADRFNPKDNVEGGVKYLRFLLDTFQGDVSLAVAAYNAGLSRVAKYGGIPPYNETRTYVNRVLSYMKSYQESGI